MNRNKNIKNKYDKINKELEKSKISINRRLAKLEELKGIKT